MHRFRPILLTAAAAILGMIPIAPTIFWGPMAYAIMGGLAVATLLTLVFLPALYVAWFRIKRPAPATGPEPATALITATVNRSGVKPTLARLAHRARLWMDPGVRRRLSRRHASESAQ